MHHPPDTDLVLYAAGVLGPSEELFIASHASLCPGCRHRVEVAEAVGGDALRSAPLGHVPAARLNAVLDVLEATPAPPPTREPVAHDEVLPAALRRWSGPLTSLRWRRVAPTIRLANVGLPGAERRTFLAELGSAAAIPTHDHTGLERAMVLRGGFTDEHSHYGVGDVSWHDDRGHRVVIDSGGPCIALFVTDGPFALGSVLATKLVDWWLGTRP